MVAASRAGAAVFDEPLTGAQRVQRHHARRIAEAKPFDLTPTWDDWKVLLITPGDLQTGGLYQIDEHTPQTQAIAISVGGPSKTPTPWRKSAGKMRNIGRVGSTSQNVPSESAAIRSLSPVSRQSQIMARIEIRGKDNSNAP